MKNVILKIGIVVALLNVSIPAFAQLLMEQSKVTLEVYPGETVVDSVTLHNTSKERGMSLRIYWQDFIYIPPFTGRKKFRPAGSSDYSLNDWISFSPKQVNLAPLSKKDIKFTIKVPQDAVGGYYGVMFFEEGAPRQSTETGVTIVKRLGSLFFVESTNKDKTAKVEGIQATATGFTGSFLNLGNIFMFPKGTYYVMNEEGLVAERGELKKIYLPPDKEARFDINLSDETPPGQYTLVLTFDLGAGDAVVKEIDFAKDMGTAINILQLRD